VNNHGIVVLGMHRGGTSLTAELVCRWGAYGNESGMIEADAGNPNGYWEYAPLVRFNNELLEAVNASWSAPPVDGDKAVLTALAHEPEFRSRAVGLLEQMQAGGRPWFWKDPRLSIVLPFWKQLWGCVVYVVAVRDPSDIALSLGSRDGFSTWTSFALWERYTLEILSDGDIRSAALFVSYEELLEDGIRECGRLCRFLDGQVKIQPPDPDRRPETMAAAIAPELRRNRSGRRFLENPLATAAQKTLYQALRWQTNGLAQEVPGRSRLESLWREYLVLKDPPRPAASLMDCCQVYWRSPGGEYDETRSESVIIKGNGQPETVEVSFPPGQAEKAVLLRIDLSRRPGLLHLREMAVKDGTGNVVWAWDGRRESIETLPRNQIQFCSWDHLHRGCMVHLDGEDPWIELALDASQSAVMTNGGAVTVQGTYFSTSESLLKINVQIMTEIREFSTRLDVLRESSASESRILSSLSARIREVEDRLQATLENEQARAARVRKTAGRLRTNA
jgi:hypothetical protein